MAGAWETVLQQAARRFEATARLTWVDYTHLDLTRVFAAAVQSVYGLSLPRVSVPSLSLPSAEPQASIHPVDMVQHGVKPLESPRQLSATSSELQQLREVRRNAYPDYPEYDRHIAFYVDCKLTVIGIDGVRILMAFRIEPQPDNVGADAAMQPEQQDDEASEAELPELVADSDDEEDFVPCWEEDVPDHVANVIASCFTLRASPMDADPDSDEEPPSLMEDSSDDDDVYEELTIMTQTEPEVEAALDSEPLAAGACYALRAEDPSADNLQQPDCPSDDQELKDGTAMPLREHEDEIPDWRELRRQRQAAGRLHLIEWPHTGAFGAPNEKHLGRESPREKVTSKFINPKDSKQPHHWAISEDWKDKEGFAALMDSDPEWYAWGLDDLRAVDAEPYDFQLVDYNPVFKRQYHLAHREQEWANNWVKKLEKAGIVGEIESP
eukprot:jgi/Tetstr1/442540/TSEL_030638.t1